MRPVTRTAAVGANFKTQNLTTELYKGGLASSLELIYAQLATLNARIDLVVHQGRPAKVIRCPHPRARRRLEPQSIAPDEQIQPFGTFQYANLEKPPPAGGIDVNADNNHVYNDLTKPPTR